MRDPELVVGDGAMGLWKALVEVFPATRHQRCWVHKARNVANCLPKSAQPGATKAMQEIYNAEDRAHAEKAIEAFARAYGPKWPKAVARIIDDRDELLAFYDFPAEHWSHLRTTNPIESTFSTVKLRTKVTRGAGSPAAALAMVFKLVESAQARWPAITGAHLVPLVRAGARFESGTLASEGRPKRQEFRWRLCRHLRDHPPMSHDDSERNKAVPANAPGGLIIFLNGTSSSGKSSIARELLQILDESFFHMPVDAFHAMRSDRDILDENLQAEIDRTAMGFHRAVAGMAAVGNNVVVDHVLSQRWRLLDCLDLFSAEDVVLVGVHCPLPELERREQIRGDRTPGLAARQFEQVHAHGIYDIECDTSKNTPGEAAQQIKSTLAQRPTPTAFTRLKAVLRADDPN